MTETTLDTNITTVAEETSATTDGETEKTVYADFRSANRVVPQSEKHKAYGMLVAAGITLAVLFLSRLIWYLGPALDKVYYGTLSEILYYIIIGVLFTAYIIALNIFVKKACGTRIFLPKKEQMTIVRALGVIAVAAVTVFLASASFKFKLKLQIEMGTGVTMATALTNIAVYFYYALHLWLGLTAAALVQRAMTILVPAKYDIPWGAIFLVAVFGLLEFVCELELTDHLYPWMYYLFTLAYAAVFVLTDYSFHLTYWTSVIILVL